jgi:hypothetical protein
MTDTSNWTLPQLKEYFEDKIHERDQRYDLQFRHDQEQTEAAAKALQVKLASMNEFRAALNDSALRNITRAEAETRINSLAEKLDAVVAPLHDKIDAAKKPNWGAVGAILALFIAGAGSVWGTINLQISNAETPIALNVSSIKEQNATMNAAIIAVGERMRVAEDKISQSLIADEQSRTDRKQLNGRMHDVENDVANGMADRRGQIASINSALTEIETQFCASDVVRNLMHAHDMRIQAMLWGKTHMNETLPTDNSYYPTICHGGAGNNPIK